MLKVFFELHVGDESISDADGADFADLGAAKDDAATSLRELLTEDIDNVVLGYEQWAITGVLD